MSDYFLEIKNLTKYFPLNNDVLSRLTGLALFRIPFRPGEMLNCGDRHQGSFDGRE